MSKETKKSQSTSDAVRYHYGYAVTGKPTQHCPPKGKPSGPSTRHKK